VIQSEEVVINGRESSEFERVDSGGDAASLVESVLVCVFMVVLASALLTLLVQLWPGPTPAGGDQPTTITTTLLFWSFGLTDEVRLLLLVVFTGALGGLLHAMRSVAWYIGQRELKRNWLATYVTQPFVGATLAFLFYLVIRGGFFSPQASFQQTSPFGFAAMAGLIGLFSPQAVLKLKEVAEVILTKPPAGKDNAPQETGVQPAAARARLTTATPSVPASASTSPVIPGSSSTAGPATP